MRKHLEGGEDLVTDLEFVVDCQILLGTAFSHNVLECACTRGVRSIIVQREGEGEIRLSIGSNADVCFFSASNWVVADRID